MIIEFGMGFHGSMCFRDPSKWPYVNTLIIVSGG